MSAPLTGERAIERGGTPERDGSRSVFTFRDGVSRSWRPAPALTATAAFHLGGVLSLAGSPLAWPWVLGALAANHGLLLAASLSPRSQWIGPNRVHLPESAAGRREVAVTFDDGPDPELTPRVLDLLDEHGARASFFCIGERAAAHPDLVREIVARGHSVESHGQRHSPAFASYGPWRLMRDLETAQRVIGEVCGSAPMFFRAPFGTRNPMLDPTLTRLGLSYVSWTRRGFDRVDRSPARVLRRLTKGLAARDVLLLHDGGAPGEPSSEATVLSVLPPLLSQIADRGLRAVSLRTACADERDAREKRALIDAVAARYRPAGAFAERFARSKLAQDPIYFRLLEHGAIPDGARVLDLGCGQALLPCLLAEASTRGGRPRLLGIESSPEMARRARLALGSDGAIEQCDLRVAALPQSDVIALLDVVHYLEPRAQDALLERIAAALAPGGVLLLRVCDDGARARAAVTRAADRFGALFRGERVWRLHGRSAADWIAALERLGLRATVEPASRGTPFANVLISARRAH